LYIRDISHNDLLPKSDELAKIQLSTLLFHCLYFETDRNIPGLVVFEETGFTPDKYCLKKPEADQWCSKKPVLQ